MATAFNPGSTLALTVGPDSDQLQRLKDYDPALSQSNHSKLHSDVGFYTVALDLTVEGGATHKKLFTMPWKARLWHVSAYLDKRPASLSAITVDVLDDGTSVFSGSPATLTPFAGSGDGGGTVAPAVASPTTTNPAINTALYDIASGSLVTVTNTGTGGTAVNNALSVVLTFQRL